jgi:hypothetical protein
MRYKLMPSSLLFLALLLAQALTARASTTWYVDGVTGSDSNTCSAPTIACKTIAHAISVAASGDAIMVAPATYTETLTINISLKVIGSSAATTIVDGGHAAAVFTISAATANVTLSNLTIRNGSGGTAGGGVINDGALTINSSSISGNGGGAGGGISNSGALRIHNSTISSNGAASGGGIGNSGTLTISDSTINGNGSYNGGGIINRGTLRINRCTLSGNTVGRICSQFWCLGGYGGAIANLGGQMTINNSTLSGNLAASSGGGISNEVFLGVVGRLAINNSTVSGNGGGHGGGIYNTAKVTLQNSIVANSPSGGNCYGIMTSNGYNLSSDGTCTFTNTGDLNNTDPILGTLQNNGGPTLTMALSSGSPAIDAGNPSGCTDGQGHLLKTDQRGKPRPDPEDAGGCDIGAYESQSD